MMGARKTSESKASRAVDRQLAQYRSMRDFEKTAEPTGSASRQVQFNTKSDLPFVVQKHDATRLHYDFRLGWNGVLKSWAVTKGPSFYPGDKRLAVQVEDHPIEYGGFEGAIPKGQYGGGTVMVWDYGTWTPEGDADRGLADGHLKFILQGSKLKGKWALVRMHSDKAHNGKPNWLLIKEKDSFARAAESTPITEEKPASAITRRSIAEIAESEDHIWDSAKGSENRAALPPDSKAGRKLSTLKKTTTDHTVEEPDLTGAPRERFPGFISPQLAKQSTDAPRGKDWLHELKLDGYRIQLHVRMKPRKPNDERQVELLTRNGLDWTTRMPDIAHAAAQLPVTSAILDGEVVVLDQKGVSSFADLQAAFQEGKQVDLTYFAFDLLHLDGTNLRELPLLNRKEALAFLLNQTPLDHIRLSEHLNANGTTVFQQACSLGAEGIISKLASSKYQSGRGNSWLKLKCIQEQELVIGGFTHPSKINSGIGALLLGYYDGRTLRYAGRSGTGFTQQSHLMLRKRLEQIKQEHSSFNQVPSDARRDVQWVKPELVAQIRFATWTADNLVRQASFKGLREDKPASEVIRESAVNLNSTKLKKSSPKKAAAGKTRSARVIVASGSAKFSKQSLGANLNLSLTHPDKIFDEKSGMTKQDLAEYYLAVAEHMLPHIADRPLSVVRCPEGSGKPCFYQKHVGPGLPKGVNSIPVPNRKTGKNEQFLTVNSAEGLVGLTQMGVLEIHPWGSRSQTLDRPDRIIFDLDPDTAIDWKTLASSADEMRNRLRKIGLKSFLKTTGGKGLHVVVPIEPRDEWPVIKEFAHNLVLEIERDNQRLYITRMTKSARAGRIYLDYLRNDRESTAVAPWSSRARIGAPVAVPLEWKELKQETMPSFHVMDFEAWNARLRRDPWKKMDQVRQQLPRAASLVR